MRKLFTSPYVLAGGLTVLLTGLTICLAQPVYDPFDGAFVAPALIAGLIAGVLTRMTNATVCFVLMAVSLAGALLTAAAGQGAMAGVAGIMALAALVAGITCFVSERRANRHAAQ